MNALVTIDTLTPAVVFAPGGVDAIISKLEADVRAVATDISTEAGRKAVASLAFKVARSKTALDEMGKELVTDIKAQANKIDAERRVIRDRLDALKDEVRKPLTDWENTEKDRVAAHEQALTAITQYLSFAPTASPAELKGFLDEINQIAQRDWQEFSARATGTLDEVRQRLGKALADATKREAEAAELARLRAEQAAREQKEREDRIASEAANRARDEAEAKAKRDAEQAATRAAAEQARVEREKAEAVARAERAEADKKVAAEKAERDQKAAVEAERKRAADVAAKEAADKARREKDKAHRAKLNNEALAALTALGVDAELGKAVIAAIAKGEIPHVSIEY
jgi:colicin import membrane protein